MTDAGPGQSQRGGNGFLAAFVDFRSHATVQKFWITLDIGHQVKNLLGHVWKQCASLYDGHIVSLPNNAGER